MKSSIGYSLAKNLGVQLVVLAIVALSSVSVLADVTITLEADGVERMLYLTPDRMAMSGPDGVMIYDAKQEVLRMVDPNTKTVRSITKADLETLSAMASRSAGVNQGDMEEHAQMMEEARKKAMEGIKDLPEDQQKAAMEMINKQMPSPTRAAGEQSIRTFEPMNKIEKITDYECTGYTIKEGDQVVGELWAAKLDEVDLSEADMVVIGKLRHFFATGVRDMPFMEDVLKEFATMDPKSDEFLGLPIRKIELEDGTEEIHQIVSIKKGKIDAKVFESGKDYEQKGLMDR